MNYAELKRLQALSLEEKICVSEARISEWYRHWEGKVYVSFSGGKDSTVLLHLVRLLFPEVPAVFVNTGLEFPEIIKFAVSQPNVVVLRPKMSYAEVIRRYGYPVISKSVSRYISDVQNASPTNRNVVNLRLTGFNRQGVYCPTYRIPQKWLPMINAPFKISDKCCDIMKKKPLDAYSKTTGRMPISGTMTGESNRRLMDWLRHGCNLFEAKQPISLPLSFWTTQDILKYLKEASLSYASVYGRIAKEDGLLKLTGESRTGCTFCMFGVHLEKEPNRFQRLKETHLHLWHACINKLGCGEVLDYIGVPYGKEEEKAA